MLRIDRSRSTVIFFTTLVLLCLFYVAWMRIATQETRALSACATASYESDAKRIDCVYAVLEQIMAENGITATMSAFEEAYVEVPVFSRTGCHTHAHRVGDMAYYRFYIPTRSFDDMDLGVETGACGYGFYHGFLEHLVQGRPDPAFVTETCEYLEARLGNTLGDIRQICYHGSGHGFMLSYVENLPQEKWGDVEAFVRMPLSQCAELSRATKREHEECEEGVYNVLAEWMETKQFGFHYDDANPFLPCDTADTYAHRHACYYEMAQKLDRVAHGSPAALYSFVSRIADPDLQATAFQVGIAGMVQSVANTDNFQSLVSACVSLPKEFDSMCAKSVLHGLFEHGQPGSEYVRALAVCEDPGIKKKGLSQVCFEAFVSRLPRFYVPEKRQQICNLIPESYRSICTTQNQ